MTLIADSGSTKTAWMEVESGNKIVTEGLNPHFTSDETFLAACQQVRNNFPLSAFNFPLFFYGAGCGSEQQRQRVARLLTKAFGTNDIHVETDMLGACRAVCGNRPGLVGILGTGSNACYYDGVEIALRSVSTGYILGDHGSANYVGRRLLQDYLTGVMPTHLTALFHELYPMTQEAFMDAVYHQPTPNRFLASLARFALVHVDDPYCTTVIECSLDDWYSYQLNELCHQSRCRDLYLVGGFASHIERTLLDCFANAHGLVIKAVLADPIDSLRHYHSLGMN